LRMTLHKLDVVVHNRNLSQLADEETGEV